MIPSLPPRCCTLQLYRARKRPVPRSEPAAELGALGGTRTPNLLIRSQMLYPLSYERWLEQYTVAGAFAAPAGRERTRARNPKLLGYRRLSPSPPEQEHRYLVHQRLVHQG